ncbi:MAG: glycosyltransferase [Gemmatimonadota bacterium]|nr:glycosyltransferase [Gemmatimonadota bacterium]
MKALFVTHSYPRFDGDSAGSFIMRLAVALRDQSVDVRVLAPAARGLAASETIAGISVRRFRYAPRSCETLAYRGTMAADVARSPTAQLALASLIGTEAIAVMRAVRTWQPDVVHAHWWFPNGLASVLANKSGAVPVVTTSHGTDLRLLRGKSFARPVARYVFQRSARVTCVSRWLAAQAAPLCRSEPTVAPMPIDVERFNPMGERDANRIVFVGRLSEQKGIRNAIVALASMRRSIELDVVGEGPERGALTELAAALGVSDRIVWHGQVRADTVAALLAGASALIAPFTDEGLGLVAAEAQLCETPPVAYASGGITDMIQDGVTGALVAPGDTTALATAVERIVTDPELRARLGRAGRTSALETFAPAAVAATYARIYREAMDSNAF